jgi:hypothetical protein
LQVTDTEILLPFNVNSSLSSREMISFLGIGGIVMLGLGVFWLIADWGQTLEMLLPILLIGLAILFLLGSMVLLQNERYFIRIDREGFCFSHLFGVALVPTVVKWSEISTLLPYTLTSLGRSIPVLGIVPYDPEALLARLVNGRSRNVLAHVVSQMNLAFYRRSSALTPLNIPQVILPISIDALIAMIQEHFAAELREYHITVRGYRTSRFK